MDGDVQIEYDILHASSRARYERGDLYTIGKQYFIICSMVFQRGGCVYILTNKMHTVLYIGVTSDLTGRIWEHKNKVYPKSFSARYNCDKLVYYYFYSRIEEGIGAEKALKDRSRAFKNNLISEMNPTWKDLYDSISE